MAATAPHPRLLPWPRPRPHPVTITALIPSAPRLPSARRRPPRATTTAGITGTPAPGHDGGGDHHTPPGDPTPTPAPGDDHGGDPVGTPAPGAGDDHGHGGGDGGHGSGGKHGGNDNGKTEFLGTIRALPATTGFIGAWTVDTGVVTVTADTDLRSEHGAPVVGGKVEVEGTLQADGSVLATRVKTEDTAREVEDNVFFGPIQALPATGITGTWKVGGLTVLVNELTRVETEEAGPVVGALARVEGIQQPDASIVATEIQIQSAAVATAQTEAPKTKLKGKIQQLPATLGVKGNWVIDGVVVTVTDDSVRVAGGRKPKVGREVTIKGKPQLNGSILAGKVSVPPKTH